MQLTKYLVIYFYSIFKHHSTREGSDIEYCGRKHFDWCGRGIFGGEMECSHLYRL